MRNTITIVVVLLTLIGMTTPLSVSSAPPMSHIASDYHDSSWDLHTLPSLEAGSESTSYHDSSWGVGPRPAAAAGPVAIGHHDSSWMLRTRLAEQASPTAGDHHDSFWGLTLGK